MLFYRKLMNGLYSKEDIENVLRETFIAPDNVDVLFELYWIIQLIKKNTNESQLHLMDGSQNMVASWETEFYSYKLYHNSTESNEIQFSITTDEISENSNSFLKRKYRSFTTSNLFAHEFFGRTPTKFLWRGRPDFLLEVIIRKLTKSLNLLFGKLRILQEWNTQLLG
ncbi:MAG: hypothetical protein K0S80_1716 [Neobacillus sp.]|nr:hypothetical protein [Neobacillus sp.]